MRGLTVKPRLESERLTYEDRVVFAMAVCDAEDGVRCRCAKYMEADRRDADLMAAAQFFRAGVPTVGHAYAHNGPRGRLTIDCIKIGGALP